MNNTARIYRSEILRAVLGDKANAVRAVDIERLNKIAEHLAACEEAQSIIRAKGHGTAGMTFVELARDVPDSPLGRIKKLFAGEPVPRYPDLAESGDAWSAR